LFEANLKKVLAHNADETKTWKEEVNKFSDWTKEEFKSIMGYNKRVGYAERQKLQATPLPFEPKRPEDLPPAIDWRNAGVVSPVKDQGECGSCWSFSAVETLESAIAIKYGPLWELSEQQMLDCTPNPDECGGTGGCEGATSAIGLNALLKYGGIASEWTYPYTSHSGQDFKCHFSQASTPVAGKLTQVVSLPSNQYLPLLTAIATIGPIAISVDAGSWSNYASGVYNGCNKTNPDIDHGVQLVGYGTDDTGVDFWLVRNSWTPEWGDNGYIKLLRQGEGASCGVDVTPSDGSGCKGGPPNVTVCGTCGILYDNVYPLV